MTFFCKQSNLVKPSTARYYETLDEIMATGHPAYVSSVADYMLSFGSPVERRLGAYIKEKNSSVLNM